MASAVATLAGVTCAATARSHRERSDGTKPSVSRRDTRGADALIIDLEDSTQPEAKAAYEKANVDVSTLDKRIAHVVQSCFNGRRLVVFSGGEAKDEAALLAEVTALRNGGASGSIIGRNAFQRKREDALSLLGKIVDIYKC
jgi:DhnA family fructose-bisphosphate aldolase class Ia